MTVQKWLMRIRRIDQEIDSLRDERLRMYQRLTSTTGSTDGEPVSASKDPHKMDILAEYDLSIQNRIDELIACKNERMVAINQLEDTRYRNILFSYYIRCVTWEQIAYEMHYSYMHITRLHGEALAELSKMLLNVTP